MSTSPKLKLPRVRRVRLSRFSLFARKPDIDIEIPKGVFCLAGANGIGKSTFLAAVGYGITGIVPNPRIPFRTVSQYYKDCLSFGNEYFTGRISESDRDLASITLDIELHNEVYEITRGMFEPQELRGFSIRPSNANAVVFSGDEISPQERNDEYQRRLTAAVGLQSFEQFAFLLHCVLTFDERRELLLWSQPRLIEAVFLAIGVNSEKAQRADWLKAERDDCGSRARNFQWQSSTVKREIENLDHMVRATETEKTLVPLRARFETLTNEQQEKEAELDRKRGELNDAELERMRTGSGLSALQVEYSEVFAKYFHSAARIEFHPSIKTSLAESTCAICGSKGAEVVSNIESKVKLGKCPLCNSVMGGTSIAASDTEQGLKALEVVDQQIAEMKGRFDAATKTKERLVGELRRGEASLAVTNAEVTKLLSENEVLTSPPVQGSADLIALRETKVVQMEDLLKKSREQYSERDRRQEELLLLYDELRQKYVEAQIDFVPLFRKLSGLFIGMDMDIRMEYNTSISTTGPQLVIEMEGTARRQTYQLSESQRFFLDIALRMALTNYMSDPEGRACLFIDTPEGSLDIAYESRAGQMFAEFVDDGHDIMMTANINSSQILRKMASRCGKANMVLYRMMPWAELSRVQQEEEPLFKEAYDKIEAELEKGGATDG